jgi:hypothetical protein
MKIYIIDKFWNTPYKASTGSLSPEWVIFGISVTLDPETGGK